MIHNNTTSIRYRNNPYSSSNSKHLLQHIKTEKEILEETIVQTQTKLSSLHTLIQSTLHFNRQSFIDSSEKAVINIQALVRKFETKSQIQDKISKLQLLENSIQSLEKKLSKEKAISEKSYQAIGAEYIAKIQNIFADEKKQTKALENKLHRLTQDLTAQQKLAKENIARLDEQFQLLSNRCLAYKDTIIENSQTRKKKATQIEKCADFLAGHYRFLITEQEQTASS